MFRIKICGVTSESDIDAVAGAGADAVGLNFHPSSIRFVDPSVAARLSEHAVQNGLTRVGVFVDQSAEEVARIAGAAQIDSVQLHGGQSLEDARWLGDRGWQVIRVLRLAAGPLELETIRAVVEPWMSGEFPFLLDADAGTHGGGLGLRLDWETIGRWSKSEGFSENLSPAVCSQAARWALAGGLTPETVGQAIASSRARSVDVASGVEEPRGQKSRHKIRVFVHAALAAWGRGQPT